MQHRIYTFILYAEAIYWRKYLKKFQMEPTICLLSLNNAIITTNRKLDLTEAMKRYLHC